MKSSSEYEKSQLQQWLTDGFKRGKLSDNSRPATSAYDQDKTDDEYQEAQEETKYYLPKEPTELEDMTNNGCDQKTDLNKALCPKIYYDTDVKPQRTNTGHARDNDGRDGGKDGVLAPKFFSTVNNIPTLGGKRREENAPGDKILISVPGHTGEGRRDEHLQAGQIVDPGQGPTPRRESPCAGHIGGDRKDEQRQSDQISSKLEKDNGPRTMKDIQVIGRGTIAYKHPSPQRYVPRRTPATCGCIVL